MIDVNFVRNLAKKDSDINEYLMSLYRIPVGIGAKTIVELGIGNSTAALLAAANKTLGELYSVDLSITGLSRISEDATEIFKNEVRFSFVEGNDLQVVKKWNKKIDFLLIDSDHTYEHVRLQLQDWLSWVRRKGIIAMHDVDQKDPNMGVGRALVDFLYSKEGLDYEVIYLSDTKGLGMAILLKL